MLPTDYISGALRAPYVIVYDDTGRFKVLWLLIMTGRESKVVNLSLRHVQAAVLGLVNTCALIESAKD